MAQKLLAKVKYGEEILMGYEYGDAQNIAVRVFLYQFSKGFDLFFDKNGWKQKTLEYFDNKCPYTGVPLSKGNMDEDHIIPFNREHCGLHLYGNVLIVSREANRLKHGQSIEEFLRNEPEKLGKIQCFMKDSGFSDLYNQYNEELKLACRNLYNQIRITIEGNCRAFALKNSVNSHAIRSDSNLQKTISSTPTYQSNIAYDIRKTSNTVRDNTQYKINFLNPRQRSLSNLPKGRVPTEVFRFLLENNLMSDGDLSGFRNNRFGRTFCKNYGDIEFNCPPQNDMKRFNLLQVNGHNYYVCNQWGIDCLPAFNNYINSKYGQYIEISEN